MFPACKTLVRRQAKHEFIVQCGRPRMASRYLAIGSLALLLTTLAASSAVSPLRLHGPRPNLTPGNARLYVIGSRSVPQRQSAAAGKLDSELADLSRHA